MDSCFFINIVIRRALVHRIRRAFVCRIRRA